ncbi:hypothetical protein BGP77_15955 [Saccharospirillum sp. MSK14-1]|uniref:DUF2938 domain-containing protein n=1 Tax=Saccharospirillum sp. MSK14-1 TaxID=1897632 RepID=UPI000D3BB333|nr:DUF2938 domain-containing protein [Saccharospirillum sp. MSK14-1]PTY37953.1 hypothetical protein BGP77_15955 [Saccharospirillum sp. MSK14-1]
MNLWLSTLLMGVAATAFIDLWSLVRAQWLGVTKPDFGLVWRWMAGIPAGRLQSPNIQQAPAVPGEAWLGWCAHYAIGVSFAAALIAWQGEHWLTKPTLLPALVVGLVTVMAPFLLMQPGMGLGIAAAKTAHPNSARLHSLITHLLFGFGLYGSAVLIQLFRHPLSL